MYVYSDSFLTTLMHFYM